ncbi:MAG: potassium-transporting ATPase subunit KdpC [Candidatus Eisenbacteria bacterium]
MKQLKSACLLLLVLTLLTGVVYPLTVTGVATLLFPRQAAGSLLREGAIVRGSSLIGQSFDDDPRYFWGRLSATAPMPYNAAASSGSNLGPSNPALAEAARRRLAALQAADSSLKGAVPIDLVTASGSGLDPHISLAAALIQIPRIARARGLDATSLEALVRSETQGRTFGLLGRERVNVLLLNRALDQAR